MRAVVNSAGHLIRRGEDVWPFRLDVREGCATIVLAGADFQVRPLSWQEKLRLATFAHIGEGFVQSSFLACCVTGGGRLTADDEQVLMALARWINQPDGDDAGLPFDGKGLCKVTRDVCRSMNVGPAAILGLPASMVESLWQSLEPASSFDGRKQTPADAPLQTKIVIIPDAAPTDTPPRTASATPASADPPAAPWHPAAPIEQDASAAPDPGPPAAEPPAQADRSADAPTGLARATDDAPEISRPARSRDASVAPAAAPAGPGRRQPRFRVSLPADAPNGRRTPQRPRPDAAHAAETPAVAAAASGNSANPPAIVSGDEPPSRSATSPIARPGAVDLNPSTRPQALLPAQFTDMAAVDLVLDELCRRLDEAAADLGILEEV